MTFQFSNVKRLLIANRGEIACCLIESCQKNGIYAVAIFSQEDADSLHVLNSDEAVKIPGVGSAAYINIEEVVNVAVTKDCQVVLPGYGFLSENCDFATLLQEKGIIFAGPSPKTIELFGLKHLARDLAIASDTPVVPGSGLITKVEDAIEEANKIGYPVMLKLSAGGGGMGLKICYDDNELKINFTEVKSRGESLFKNGDAFLEKYIQHGRHIEVQIFGNGNGDVLSYGERECSLQRRHQKVIEESPSPFISMPRYNQSSLRKSLSLCAARLASSVNYKSAGTVEFIVDDDTGKFYFLEANVRLQVEHPVTEAIYNVDLVKLMLMQAEFEARGTYGIPLDVLKLQGSYQVDDDEIAIPNGHAIECRLYAENPVRNFLPCPGILHNVEFYQPNHPDYSVRVDHWISTGSKVSPYFDPLLAKIIVWGKDRETAKAGMLEVLMNSKIQGPPTNLEYLREILKSSSYAEGKTLTNFLEHDFEFKPHLMEFIESGAYTTIQDLPGRETIKGGVPLSGPSDPLSFEIANIIVDNDSQMEALEILLKGPKIKFHGLVTIALAGGKFDFHLDDDIELPMFTAISLPAGSVVSIGNSQNQGAKCYLAIKGGFPDVAEYLGSKACTPTLSLGGHQGRTVLPGDCLSIIASSEKTFAIGYKLPKVCMPNFDLPEDHVWKIRMLKGPHDSPDICSEEGLEQLCNSVYKVNLNSNRGAQRLDGPEMKFSRKTGGDGGLHPSNILEYPVATNCLSAVGGLMVLYGVDGATMSGFVAISIPVQSDWWKFGQAKIGASIGFEYISYGDSIKLYHKRRDYLKYLTCHPGEDEAIAFDDKLPSYEKEVGKAILYQRSASESLLPLVSFRQAGEKMIVIDFGTDKFSLLNNGRQHVLETMINDSKDDLLQKALIKVESTSGAMAVVFDFEIISQQQLLKKLIELEASIPPTDQLKIPSTIYKLPLSFDHSSLRHCIERYMHSQRPYASYLPDNTKFVMDASCIPDLATFKDRIIGKPEVITAVSFLCANTLLVHPDPRLRFMTQKYNPARTFTPRGAIGTGSVSQSIYSVDSPGGYMIWGMTLPSICWDTFGKLKLFKGNPWFLKNFDQIEFYEVSELQLNKLNDQLITGELEIETRESVFDFEEYNKFLSSVADEAELLKLRQIQACENLTKVETQMWEQWMDEKALAKESRKTDDSALNDPTNVKLEATMASSVFKINVTKGDIVSGEDVVIILEAMKMEIAIRVSGKQNYKVLDIVVDEGDMVNPADCLAILKPI